MVVVIIIIWTISLLLVITIIPNLDKNKDKMCQSKDREKYQSLSRDNGYQIYQNRNRNRNLNRNHHLLIPLW